MTDVVERLAAAMNEHDLTRVAALIDQDYRSEQPAHPGREFVGRAQMVANWRSMFDGIPDLHTELVRSVQGGSTTWSEWHWTGTRIDGSPFEVRGTTLFEVAHDHIVAGRLYLEEVEHHETGIAEVVESLSGVRPEDPVP